MNSQGGLPESGVSSTIFSYFKGAVGTLVEPFTKSRQRELDTTTSSQGFSPILQLGNTGASSECSGSSSLLTSSQVGKRPAICGQYCCSSSANEDSSSQNGHDGMCSKMMRLLAIHTQDGLKETQDVMVRLGSEFNGLLWIQKYLKCNTLKNNEELVTITSGLCRGLKKVVNLSEFNFTDGQLSQFFHLVETLFEVLHYYNYVLKEIHNKVDGLFDNMLEQLANDKRNAGSQLLGYAFVSGVMNFISDHQFRQILLWRIFQRLKATVMSICKGYCQTYMLKSKDVNLLFLYCQLLESAVTFINCEPSQWIKNSTLVAILDLEKAAGPLFALFPNLNYIFQPTIEAVRQHTEHK